MIGHIIAQAEINDATVEKMTQDGEKKKDRRGLQREGGRKIAENKSECAEKFWVQMNNPVLARHLHPYVSCSDYPPVS